MKKPSTPRGLLSESGADIHIEVAADLGGDASTSPEKKTKRGRSRARPAPAEVTFAPAVFLGTLLGQEEDAPRESSKRSSGRRMPVLREGRRRNSRGTIQPGEEGAVPSSLPPAVAPARALAPAAAPALAAGRPLAGYRSSRPGAAAQVIGRTRKDGQVLVPPAYRAERAERAELAPWDEPDRAQATLAASRSKQPEHRGTNAAQRPFSRRRAYAQAPTFGNQRALPSMSRDTGDSGCSSKDGGAAETNTPSLIADGEVFDITCIERGSSREKLEEDEGRKAGVESEPSPPSTKASAAMGKDLSRRGPMPFMDTEITLGPAKQVTLSNFPIGKEAIDFSKKVKTMPLSALAGAPRPPLIVRLARVRDLGVVAVRGHGHGYGGELCGLPSPPSHMQFIGKQGPQISEYAELSRQLFAQRALGAPSNQVDMKALLMWYAPYVFVVAAYVALCGLLRARSAALLALPLLAVVVPAHLLRLAWCDRVLFAATDLCAAADFRTQVQPPLGGWGDGLFGGTLEQAIGALSTTQGFLLTQPRAWSASASLAPASALLAALLATAAAAAVAQRSEESRPHVFLAEALVSALVVLVLVFVCCSPRATRTRAEEADGRLHALEAAFGAMLDALKPLLPQQPRDWPMPLSPTAEMQPGLDFLDCENRAALASEQFSVRLVTAEGLTLRASAQLIFPSGALEAPSLCVACPLAGFGIVAGGLQSVTLTDIGRNEDLQLAASLSASPPRGAGAGTSPGLSMTAWAMALVAARQSPNNRTSRQDDETSISMMSSSTASTYNPNRSQGHKDEATVHLAMSTVMALSRRDSAPLEAFCLRRGALGAAAALSGTIVPPKAAIEEPALLLALPPLGFKVLLGDCPAREEAGSASWLRFRACCLGITRGGSAPAAPSSGSGSGQDLQRESYGVLRSAAETRRLCSSGGGSRASTPGTGTPASLAQRLRLLESPRSAAVWQSQPDSEDEVSPQRRSRSKESSPHTFAESEQRLGHSHGAPVPAAELRDQKQQRYLAIVFDTYRDRNRCHQLMMELLPRGLLCKE